MPRLQTMLSTQSLSLLPSALHSEANKNTHFLLFLLYAIKQYFQAGNYPPPPLPFFSEWKRKCFETETDQKAAGVALNFSQERRYCNYKALASKCFNLKGVSDGAGFPVPRRIQKTSPHNKNLSV